MEIVDTQRPARHFIGVTRAARLPIERVHRRRELNRRQTATIVYQYRSAHSCDCILYPRLSPLNDRGIIPWLIDEHHCRSRWTIPLSFRREVFLSAAWKRTGFCGAAACADLVKFHLVLSAIGERDLRGSPWLRSSCNADESTCIPSRRPYTLV